MKNSRKLRARTRVITLGWAIATVVLSGISALAAQKYRISNGAAQVIEEQGVCRYVVNSSGRDLMVPTNSAAGWASFYNNSHSGVSVNICASCALPWGGSIAHGASVTAYSNNAPLTPNSCTSQTRSCYNGSLSGSYGYGSCSNDPCYGSPAPGTTCRDGTKYVGTSGTGTKMYTTPSDGGTCQYEWPETSPFRGYSSTSNGEYNTNGLAAFGTYRCVNNCYNSNANGRSDWYLPAPNEWNTMDAVRASIGGFQACNTLYWTSRERDDGGGQASGFYHKLCSTFNGYTGAGQAYPYRCVRSE